MTALGDTLRRERLRRNLDYEAISRELKISPRILQAIEEEQFDKLPGGVFAKGFVRQYARVLGLDEEAAVAAAQRLMEPGGAPTFGAVTPEQAAAEADRKLVLKAAPIEVPRMDGWEHIGDRRQLSRSSTLTALALVVGVMLVCSLVYGWWQRDRHPAARPAAVANVTPPAETAPAPPQAQANQPTVTPESSTASVPAEPLAAAAQPIAGASPNSQSATVSLPSAASSGPAGPVHVELTALEPVWVTAHSDGKYAFSGMLAADQTKTVDASENAVLRIGNAGGVRISLNGKPIGDIGPRGQVRTVQFTSGGFHIVVAPKVSDPIGLL